MVTVILLEYGERGVSNMYSHHSTTELIAIIILEDDDDLCGVVAELSADLRFRRHLEVVFLFFRQLNLM